MRVGLTGGIASGKSTVARRFAQLGVPVIDADEVARAVVAPGEPALAAVVRRFGPGVLLADGSLDRRALRSLVFADREARRELEAILHPPIRAAMERLAGSAAGPYVILSIPLLVEGGDARSRVDRILVIDAPEELQLARLQARDGSSADEARAMLAAQASRAARLALADDVLDNCADLATLNARIDALHQRYLALAAV
jgi:dephospho-CoA kinase